MAKYKFTAIHPLRKERKLCYITDNGMIKFAIDPNNRYARNTFKKEEVVGLLPAKG